MKKRILWVLAALALLVVAVLGAGALQRPEFRVERSEHVAAKPAQVYAVMSDLRRFGSWSPWSKLDPNLTSEVVQTPERGAGATYTWSGNDDVGRGKMIVTKVVPDERMDLELQFIEPWENHATIAWALQPDGEGTKVTWSMEGKHEALIEKTMCMFVSLDKMLGKDFSEGLGRLAHLVEAGAPAAADGAPAAADSPAELAVGGLAPDFTAETHLGQSFTLSEQKGKAVIVYFYPKDETRGCTAEAEAFRDDFAALQAKGAIVVGVSADSLESHRAFAEAHQLPFALVSDPDGAIARRFGVPFRTTAQRQTFVVGKDGKLARIYRTVDVAGHAADIQSAI